MNKAMKIIIVAALVGVVGAVLAMKANQTNPTGPTTTDAHSGQAATQQSQPLPHLVDLGASKCIPCKMMAPILEELKADYAGVLQVSFYDVWENPEAGKQYGIRVIPTQIFFDAAGKELWRHEGFMAKEDILAKWKELGFDFGTGGSAATTDME
ncbi:MAG: thioredoxin family protein [Planctomycetota bacterium]